MKLDILYWGDDWIALYKDGELVAEDHSLRLDTVFDALGLSYEIKHFFTEDELYLWNGLPQRIEDVQWEKNKLFE